MIALMAKQLQPLGGQQELLLKLIDEFLTAEQEYRADLRRSVARLEAHKANYLSEGIKSAHYQELYLATLAAVKISQKISSAFTVKVESTDNSKLAVKIQEQINSFLAEINELELQNSLFNANKARYFIKYCSEEVKKQDIALAEIALGGVSEKEAISIATLEGCCELIAERFKALAKFLKQLNELGLEMEVNKFSKVITNCDLLLRQRLLSFEIGSVINKLKTIYPQQVAVQQRKALKFMDKRDMLKDLILDHILKYKKTFLENEAYQKAAVKKLVELLIQNAAYFQLVGTPDKAKIFQKRLVGEIRERASAQCAEFILQRMIEFLELKKIPQLRKTRGFERVRTLAESFFVRGGTG